MQKFSFSVQMSAWVCLLFTICIFCVSGVLAQNGRRSLLNRPVEGQSDTLLSGRYNEVITEPSETQNGLFVVHKVGYDYYFELPERILEKEILIISRISAVPNKFSPYGAGVCTKVTEDHQVVRFQRHGNSILMRLVSYNDVADKELPIYQSVKSNNFEPVIYRFNIEAVGNGSHSFVIDVEEFFTSDISLIGVQTGKYKLAGVDRTRSFISSVKVFSQNVEVRHILTYRAADLPYKNRNNSLSFELTQSMILLPENPMDMRLHDQLTSFFSIKHIDYGSNDHRATEKEYIIRWRLEPSDWESFIKGDLVEPVKPIVYYLDPATPVEWIPYIKQGVEDWQKAFEKIGFKNAIMAKEPPTPEEDPNWSINDFRNSVIRYVATESSTATGFYVHDPRTGEILRGDIHWGHNSMNKNGNRFFVQTAAANPDARHIRSKNEVMGELIRSIIAHEVGHTLGMSHSFAASRAYLVDSLRSPSFTRTHGNSASVMDYAWANYVAQPEDSVVSFHAKIGEYDYWMVKYGYEPIPNTNDPIKEKEILRRWIKNEVNNRYIYFPRGMTGYSDLGDDPIYASELGIKNLKTIRKNLLQWTSENGKDFENLTEINDEIYRQFEKYLEPVQLMIGGYYFMHNDSYEDGPVSRYVSREMQKKAITFLHSYLFQTPTWLTDHEILKRVPGGLTLRKSLNPIKEIQQRTLDGLLRSSPAIIQNELLNGEEAYSLVELYEDLRKGIFNELKLGKKIDVYRRSLQKVVIEAIGQYVDPEQESYKCTDASSVALGTLLLLKSEIQDALPIQKDKLSKYHLQDLLLQIERIVTIR